MKITENTSIHIVAFMRGKRHFHFSTLLQAELCACEQPTGV